MPATWLALIVGGFLLAFAVLVQVPRTFAAGIQTDDFDGYVAAAQRFLETGSPYTAVQLAGPYPTYEIPTTGLFLHPPTSLVLFVPFAWLPAVLWWAIPLAILGWSVWRMQPSALGWAVILVLAAWPRTVGAVLLGNSDLWVAAGVATGFRYGWPAALILLKPTLAPFALVGIRHRSWWATVAVLAVVSVPFLPLWPDYVTVIRNAEGGSLLYSLPNVPLLLIPVVAWWTRTRPAPRSRSWSR